MEKTKLKEEEKPSTSAPEDKFEMMMKTMEKLMDRLALGNAPAPPAQQEPRFRNPQFIKLQNQQRPRENINQHPDPPVRPPFQQNLVDEENEPKIPEESIHCFDEEVSRIFLTKEEHDESSITKPGEELSDYLKGYQHAIFEMKKQYNLKNRNVPITASKAQPKKDASKAVEDKKDSSKVAEGKNDSPPDKKVIQAPSPTKEIEKTVSSFNIENEIAKIKISVPFNEILKVDKYRSKIVEMLNSQPGVAGILNVQEDNPIICLGPRLEDEQNEEFHPFYISISIHDMTLHNTMLDSGASHNLMPKVIMERLGLEVTRPYKELFSFDSKRVQCIGLIKDVVVALTQIPAKTIVMDIVVADIPPNFGMLLSRSWAAKIKGTM